MTAHRRSRTLLLAVVAIALAAPSAALPAQAVVDPSVPADARTVLEGDLTQYQWMLGSVNAPQAWTQSTGSGVTIAVIDTGVDAQHPDLVGRVVPGGLLKVHDDGTSEVVEATLPQTSNDWYGHGTHVAGIAAGDEDGNGITGLAPDASVMPIRILTKKSEWFTPIQFLDSVTQSIDFAAAHGADVMNMSLGLPNSHLSDVPENDEYRAAVQRLCDAVAAARSGGSVVVVSAGNEGSWENYQSVPAACPGAISVAATGPDLRHTYWSSFDGTVDVAAPGLSVLSGASSASGISKADHIEMSGTSMSAPVVTGLAALLLADDPSMTPDDVETAITSTAQDVENPGRDPVTGYGLVDAAAALGVNTPVATASDFFTSWISGTGVMFKSTGPTETEGVVGWTIPGVHAINGYTVKVYDSSGTTDHALPGDAVRLQLLLETGAWVQVVAHTTAGDVATFPVEWGGDGTWIPPKKVRNPQATRTANGIRAHWEEPTDTTGISGVAIVAQPAKGWKQWSTRIDWDGVEPFPTKGTLRLPKSKRWTDMKVWVVSLAPANDGSDEEFGNPKRVPGLIPAWFGLHISAVDAVGKRSIEISGGVSKANARLVCGGTCSGVPVEVTALFRGSVTGAMARISSAGLFHLTIDRPKGQDSVRVQAVGPEGLTSGPAKRFAIPGGGAKG